MVDILTLTFFTTYHILMLLSLNIRFFGSLANQMLISLKSIGVLVLWLTKIPNVAN